MDAKAAGPEVQERIEMQCGDCKESIEKLWKRCWNRVMEGANPTTVGMQRVVEYWQQRITEAARSTKPYCALLDEEALEMRGRKGLPPAAAALKPNKLENQWRRWNYTG